MKQYDAIIIGFGKAGKTLAAELSNRGWQVAIVERSNMMYGGSCPNVACIPTKTLVHEAEVSALLYHDDFPKQANMYKQAIGRKNRLTSFLRNDNYERLSKRPNVTIYWNGVFHIRRYHKSGTSRRRNRTERKRDIYQHGVYSHYPCNRWYSAKSARIYQ